MNFQFLGFADAVKRTGKLLLLRKSGPEKRFKRAYKKGRSAIKYRNLQCLNCNYPLNLTDRYCPNCSQLNSNKKLGLRDLFEELFSSLFSYDSKLKRTFKVMLFMPGKITREYVSGKRMKYANPFRFLLSLAIIYFFMLNCSNNFKELDHFGVDNRKDSFSFKNGKGINWKFTSREDREKRNESAKTLSDEDIRILMDSIQRKREKRDSVRLLQPVAYFDSLRNESWLSRFPSKVVFFQSGIRKGKINRYPDVTDSLELNDTYENKLAFNSAGSLVRAANQPGSYLSFVMSKLPFMIFFFMPVFAVFIWLVYSKKKYSYSDHLIFSFHTEAMLIILLIISFILELIFVSDIPTLGALLIFLFYLYKAMRNFYAQRRLKTIVKFMFLNSFFFILATVTIIFFFIGSVFIY